MNGGLLRPALKTTAVTLVVAAVLSVMGCQKEEPVAVEPPKQGGTVTDVSVKPEFEGDFVPGVFVLEEEEETRTLTFSDGGRVSVVVKTEDEEKTHNGRWERIFDGVSVSYRSEPSGGEPQTFYFKGLGEDDLTDKGSKKVYKRQSG